MKCGNGIAEIGGEILSGRLLLLDYKSNLSVKFKFELIITNHLWFVVKMLWKYCGRIIFFNSSLDFSNHYFILFFFLPFSAMLLPQLLTFFFYSPISAMALPQLVCNNFFFPYFGNTIATISLSQIFFN